MSQSESDIYCLGQWLSNRVPWSPRVPVGPVRGIREGGIQGQKEVQVIRKSPRPLWPQSDFPAFTWFPPWTSLRSSKEGSRSLRNHNPVVEMRPVACEWFHTPQAGENAPSSFPASTELSVLGPDSSCLWVAEGTSCS